MNLAASILLAKPGLPLGALGSLAAQASIETRNMTRSDDELLTEPIIVIGAGRSGMNFLGDTIAQHGTLAVATEPRLIWKHGNDSKSDALRADDARPDVIAHIRSRFATLVRNQGKNRLIDVTPGNSLRLEFVDRVFPDCQFVHFIRDGVDNVVSMRRFYSVFARTIRPENKPIHESFMSRRTREFRLRQLPGLAMEVVRHLAPDCLLPLVGPPVLGVRLPGMVAMRREMDMLDVCFQQWRASVEMACMYGRRLPSDRYMECRIEGFSLDDVKRIFEFCNLETSPEVFEFFQNRFESKRIGVALNDADPDELTYLSDRVAPTMRWIEQLQPKPAERKGPVANTLPAADREPSTLTVDDLDWLESRTERGVLVLKFLVGRLDSKQHRKEDYRRILTNAIAAGHHHMVLNFSKLGHTNHTWGIFQLIFTANNLLKEAGGSLAVCGTKGHVHRVYTFANLGRFAPGYRSESKAVEALASKKNTGGSS